jgi:predicted transcriptional regulator
MASNENEDGTTNVDMLSIVADVVAAYVGQNKVAAGDIPDIVRSVHRSFASLGQEEAAAQPAERPKPAVPISRSVQQDYIVCLEDGAKLKMLKRYLRSRFDLSPDDYRRRWGLPADYPMVAPAYAARRSDFAKQIGLGKGVRRTKQAPAGRSKK